MHANLHNANLTGAICGAKFEGAKIENDLGQLLPPGH